MSADFKKEETSFLKSVLDWSLIPTLPGVYKILDAHSTILYIGKAKNLRQRLQSYFRDNPTHDIKTAFLVAKAHDIQTIVTHTEQEALLLENELIKNYQPKYNILLKDDKSFPYLKITHEPFPRILITRQKLADHATYYGPYANLGNTRPLLQLINQIFQLRSCKQKITLDKNQSKCFMLDIGRCLGPCIHKDLQPAYAQTLKNLHLVLTGHDQTVVRNLKAKMAKLAQLQQFEKAAQLRDQIIGIDQLTEKQTVLIPNQKNPLQIWATVENTELYYLLRQTVQEGHLLLQNGFYVSKTTQNSASDFLLNFAFQELNVAKNQSLDIICSALTAQTLAPLLKLPGYTKIKLYIPRQGLKKELLSNCLKNAQLSLLRTASLLPSPASDYHDSLLASVKTILNLKHLPQKILAFDISHLQGTNISGASVCFIAGEPSKDLYRRFNIKCVSNLSNDPLSMREAVFRRLKHALKHQEPLPQLLLIDGGLPQLNFARQAVMMLGLTKQIELIALAKKEEELYLFNRPKPLQLAHHHPALLFLQKIRDEAHRFVLDFQKSKRKQNLQSRLTSIKGIGPQKLNQLYQKYRTLDNIRAADTIELAQTSNLGLTLANEIKKTLMVISDEK